MIHLIPKMIEMAVISGRLARVNVGLAAGTRREQSARLQWQFDAIRPARQRIPPSTEWFQGFEDYSERGDALSVSAPRASLPEVGQLRSAHADPDECKPARPMPRACGVLVPPVCSM